MCFSPVTQGKDSSRWQEAKWQRKLRAQWEMPSGATLWRGEKDIDNGPITKKKSKVLAVYLLLNFWVTCRIERLVQCALSDRYRWCMWVPSGPWLICLLPGLYRESHKGSSCKVREVGPSGQCLPFLKTFVFHGKTLYPPGYACSRLESLGICLPTLSTQH